MHGRQKVEFKTHLLIEPFHLKLKGALAARIVTAGKLTEPLKIHYEFFENHVISYVRDEKV